MKTIKLILFLLPSILFGKTIYAQVSSTTTGKTNENVPTYYDNIEFIAIDNTYDYGQLFGITKEGNYFSGIVGCNHEAIYRGDIISVTEEMAAYEEAGDGSIRERIMITDIKKQIPGKLSEFYKNNKKTITYKGLHSGSWRYEDRCSVDMDYFFANTGDSIVLHCLNSLEGSLDVEFSGYENDANESEFSDNCMLAQIWNNCNGKRKLVHKLILDLSWEKTEYYLYNKESRKYEKMDI